MKEFIKLNVNMDTMIKNMKLAELYILNILNISIATLFLNTQNFKDDLTDTNVCDLKSIINTSLAKD